MAISKPVLSAFVQECQKAMEEYLRMRAEGVPREDAIKGIEMILREHYREQNGFDSVMDDFQMRAAGDERDA